MTSVLIAEDDPAIATLLTDALGDRFATHVVANGALVLDALAANRPVLLDVRTDIKAMSPRAWTGAVEAPLRPGAGY